MRHYRIEFPLKHSPAHERRLDMLEKVEILKEELKIDGHSGPHGIKALTCYAPFSNYAICTGQTEGDINWLPAKLNDLKDRNEKLEKVYVEELYIKPLKPTSSLFKSEEKWAKKLKESTSEKRIVEKEFKEKKVDTREAEIKEKYKQLSLDEAS